MDSEDSDTVTFEDNGFAAKFERVSRETYERKYMGKNIPIVIDCGAYETRAGFATDDAPRLQFRSLVSRNRTKDGKGFFTLVGNQIPYAEAYRLKPRSPFDRNVACHFESMEHIFDYIFDALGINGSPNVDHPIVITEAVCNPNFSRKKMSKLLFEAYGVPAVCYGVGDLFAYGYHHNILGNSSIETKKGDGISSEFKDGLIVSSGYEATHVIPVLDGKPDFLAAACIPVGGLQAHKFLFDSLLLRYPQHARHLSLNRCHELVTRFAVVAPGDFLEELRDMQRYEDGKNDGYTNLQPVKIQLPFTEYKPKEETPEEKERREIRKKEHADRLRMLAAKRRESKLEERQKALEGFDRLANRLENSAITEGEFLTQIEQGGFEDRDDFERHHRELRKKVDDGLARMQADKQGSEDGKSGGSTKSKSGDNSGGKTDQSEQERFPLLFMDPSALTDEQKKEKRKQLLLKSAEAGRARRRREKEQAREAMEAREREEQSRYDANPKEYVKSLHKMRAELIDQREKRRFSMRSLDRRKNLASKRRVLQAVMGTGGGSRKPGDKDEDDFGANEEDWQLYKKMAQSRGEEMDEESESEEEKEELNWLERLLNKYDPEAMKKEIEETTYPQAHDFQIELFVDRIKAAELIYQPSIIGLDVAGLPETLEGVFRKLGPTKREKITKNVVVIGGNTLNPNFCERVRYQIRSLCPEGLKVTVMHGNNPSLGSWYGAKLFANSPHAKKAYVTASILQEKSPDFLVEHTFSNQYFPTPR